MFPEPSDQEPPAGSWTHSWKPSRRRGSCWQRRPQGRGEREKSPSLSLPLCSQWLYLADTGEPGLGCLWEKQDSRDGIQKTGTVGTVHFPKKDTGTQKD